MRVKIFLSFFVLFLITILSCSTRSVSLLTVVLDLNTPSFLYTSLDDNSNTPDFYEDLEETFHNLPLSTFKDLSVNHANFFKKIFLDFFQFYSFISQDIFIPPKVFSKRS